MPDDEASPDMIDLRFEGKLADQNQMDFYEAARVQYAAARLSVKLDRFRRYGSFPKKVTSVSNTGIDLSPFGKGSFHIRFNTPETRYSPEWYLRLPLATMWAYVVERVFKPASPEEMRSGLWWEDELLDHFDNDISGRENPASQTLFAINSAIASGVSIDDDARQLAERLTAEALRREYLTGLSSQLSVISPEQDAQLITMAAPLLKELGLPLRRSASIASITIAANGTTPFPILGLNKTMAANVELTRTDSELTVLRIDLVSYDKESGWGKFRNIEFDGKAPFYVPADRKADLQAAVLRNMNKSEVLATVAYTRSLAGVKKGIVLFELLDEPFDS